MYTNRTKLHHIIRTSSNQERTTANYTNYTNYISYTSLNQLHLLYCRIIQFLTELVLFYIYGSYHESFPKYCEKRREHESKEQDIHSKSKNIDQTHVNRRSLFQRTLGNLLLLLLLLLISKVVTQSNNLIDRLLRETDLFFNSWFSKLLSIPPYSPCKILMGINCVLTTFNSLKVVIPESGQV